MGYIPGPPPRQEPGATEQAFTLAQMELEMKRERIKRAANEVLWFATGLFSVVGIWKLLW